jgi:hypothetical protein
LLATDLVRHRVAAIVASGSPAALAAKAASTTIRVIFTTGADPVALGLVASLNRPGANVTDTAVLTAELGPKRLQLVRELIPNTARFGVFADPAFPATQSAIADLQAAARTLALQLIVVNARTDSDLETAFTPYAPPDRSKKIRRPTQLAKAVCHSNCSRNRPGLISRWSTMTAAVPSSSSKRAPPGAAERRSSSGGGFEPKKSLMGRGFF